MRQKSNDSRRIFASTVSVLLCAVLLASCGGKASSSQPANAQAKKITVHEATPEQATKIKGFYEQAKVGKVIASKVDQKFVSAKYMVTGLVNSDCQVSETADTGLLIATVSGNAAISVNMIPGVQSTKKAVENLQQGITAAYSQEGTGGTFEGMLLGYKSTIIPFVGKQGEEAVNGFASAFIANQSLYSVNCMLNAAATKNELDLMEKIIASLQILKPEKTDNTAKTATYVDPYASYKTYDPYLYAYVLGQMAYDEYEKAFNEYYATIDIATWDDLPYDYYSWYEGDYSAWNEEGDYVADWDYYDDDDYWSWGWDEDTDWSFYDTYADYYSEEAYDSLTNFYDDSANYDDTYTANEEWDFGEEFDNTWEDYDTDSYEETSYEYDDYYDDYYYGDEE